VPAPRTNEAYHGITVCKPGRIVALRSKNSRAICEGSLTTNSWAPNERNGNIFGGSFPGNLVPATLFVLRRRPTPVAAIPLLENPRIGRCELLGDDLEVLRADRQGRDGGRRHERAEERHGEGRAAQPGL